MDTSTDYFKNELLITWEYGENPFDSVPDGWEVVELTQPSEYKGLKNPGTLTCKQKKQETCQWEQIVMDYFSTRIFNTGCKVSFENIYKQNKFNHKNKINFCPNCGKPIEQMWQ